MTITREIKEYCTFISQALYEATEMHEWVIQQHVKNHNITVIDWRAEQSNESLITGKRNYALVWRGYENE